MDRVDLRKGPSRFSRCSPAMADAIVRLLRTDKGALEILRLDGRARPDTTQPNHGNPARKTTKEVAK